MAFTEKTLRELIRYAMNTRCACGACRTLREIEHKLLTKRYEDARDELREARKKLRERP